MIGRLAWGLALLVSVAACGKSLFKPLSSNASDEALKEDAIIALDNDDFGGAEEKLAKLWQGDKSNEVAGLYAVALLGQGQFVMFDIIRSAILLSSNQASAGGVGGTNIMNELATHSSEILGGEVTPARQAYVLRALDVLQEAENQADAALTFQKCLTAGIYAVPILQSVSAIQAKVSEIQTTQASGNVCDNATLATRLEGELTDVITEASAVSSSLTEVGDVLQACLPKESGEQVNAVTARVQGILTKADKGCSIDPALPQTLGSATLPACLNSAIASTSAGVAAGDGKVSGCELFLHCGGGSCF